MLRSQAILNLIDSNLEFVEDLDERKDNPRKVLHKVKKGNSFYVAKISDLINSYWWSHIKRDALIMEIAKHVEGMVHLVEVYTSNSESQKYFATLSDYAQGSDLIGVDTDLIGNETEVQLERTVRDLHKIGIARLQIKREHIRIPSDNSQPKIIDFGACALRSYTDWSMFRSMMYVDLYQLEGIFNKKETVGMLANRLLYKTSLFLDNVITKLPNSRS
jgi:serine/threonine protein kinase